LWLFFGILELYLLLAVTLGIQCYHKGYLALAIAGIVCPLVWIGGVFLPAKANSYYQACHAAKRQTRDPQASTADASRPQDSKWDSRGPADGGPYEAPRTRSAAGVAAWPDDRTISSATLPQGDERTQQRLIFLRWLVATGRLKP
jgi:hypothetical protein